MKLRSLPLFVLGLLLWTAAAARAGMTIYDPPNSQTGGDFTIYYGLGSPYPGKVAYVTVTDPSGYHYTVGSAENVSDMSQVCYAYADQPGTYTFYYEYSYESQGVPQTVVYSEDHYISSPSGNPPTIEWTSAPDVAESGSRYFIEAHGHDDDGNLTAVSVWREWSPYAFNGGGNGSDEWSGNPSTDTGDQWIDYMAQSQDSDGNTSSVIYHSIHIQAAPTVAWTNVPSNVDHNTWYTVRADGHDVNGDMTGIHIYREGQPFAFELNGNGTDAYSDNADYAGGDAGTDVHYMVEAHDALGGSSGYIYTTVHINNHAPLVGWNPDTIGTVYINGQYGSTASATDYDNNLKELRVYSSRYEQQPGGNIISYGPTLYDTVSSSDGFTCSKNYNWQADKPFKDKYVWSVIAEDKQGATSMIWSISGGGSGEVDTANRPPPPPIIQASQTHIGLGESVTLSAAGSDDDQNAMNQYLWYQGPADDPNTWNYLTATPYGSGGGTGNTVANYVFTPTQLGTYKFKTRVDDPYEQSSEVTVSVAVEDHTPPNAPTNLSVSGIDPHWIALTWTRSNSDDVVEQHILWRPSSGGNLSDALVGLNVAGATITGLDAGTSYDFYVQAKDGAGNYSSPSNTATGTTAWDAPAITTQPQNQNILVGGNATLSVGVSANPPPTYQWRRNGVDIPGATNATLPITNAQRSNGGKYVVVVSNAGGTVWSIQAILNVGFTGDIDGDGMPDSWETANGLNPQDPDDALIDSDSDGLTNVAEYNLGTNPTSGDTTKSAIGGTIPAGWPNVGDPNNSHAVGTTKGELSVDKNGAATYSIPIWATPGTAGMEPKLALNYSSQAGNGIAGFGWSLSGISAVTRGPQTRAVDGQIKGVTLTSTDRFYLDGQRLIAISGTDGADGTEYRTEMDSFTKVVSYGTAGTGPQWFKAWTKAGLIIEFGHTTDSSFNPGGSSTAVSWSVSKISDTKGNYMTFTYTQDTTNGYQLLSRIDYTGNTAAGLAPYASVRLGYEGRNDWMSGYSVGLPVASTQRLKTIATYYGEGVVKTYTLNYTERTGTSRSLLTSLTETAQDNTSYPDLTFQYTDDTPGWEDTQTWKPGSTYNPPFILADNTNNRGTGAGFVDLNGDGLTDFVYNRVNGGGSGAYLNNGNGWISTPGFMLPYQLADSSASDDQGSRFVDVNGDGLVDFVWNKMGAGGNPQGSGAVINTGSGWQTASQWAPPVPIAKDGDPLRSGKFLDVDGDGRADFVAFFTASGSNSLDLAVYLNTTSGWSYSTTYSSLPISTNLAQARAQFIDVNGDGLPDIVASYAGSNVTIVRTFLNTGTGWTDAPSYYVPQLLADDVHSTVGAEFCDANGDGLPDLIWYREQSGATFQQGVALNTGTGWYSPPAGSDAFTRYAPPGPLSRDSETSAGTAIIDLNADGVPDIAMNRQFSNGHIDVQTWYGTMHDWRPQSSPAPHDLPLRLLQQGVNSAGVDFVDIDGDGVTDLVYSRKNADGSVVSGSWHNKAKPDRLIKVTNGFGVSAQLVYKPLTDSSVFTKSTGATWPDVDVASSMAVVSTVKNDDGVGGTYDVNYAYTGLRTNALRGSQGFASMTTTDTRTGIYSVSTFYQTFPLTGMAHTSTTRSGGTILSDSVVTYTDTTPTNSKVHFVFASDTVASTNDLNGAATSQTDTYIPTPSTDVDAYGNINKLVVHDLLGGFQKTTDSVYTNDTTNWFLGRLTKSTVTSTAPGKPTLTRTSGFLYDSTSGLLTDEAVEPVFSGNQLFASYTDLSGYTTDTVRTHYEYDAFGNKTAARTAGLRVNVDNAGNVTSQGSLEVRSTTSAYNDGKGRFPTTKTNAAGHTENYVVYDQNLGALTQLTGPNGLSTSWTYDRFGNKTHEARADGTGTDYRIKWANPGGPYPGNIKYLVEVEASGTAPALEFHDAFGRPIRTLAINGNGEIVYQDTSYDAMGRAYAKSNPYRNDGQTVYWTQTTSFDLLNRPLVVRTPDDEAGPGYVETGYAYNGLTTTVTDAKGRVSESTKNSQGWPTSSIRNKNAGAGAVDYAAVTYDYDALGNLVSTTASGVATSLSYDTRGRKKDMTDPDMGYWQYRYNAFDELVWQKDAKNQITTLAYDALGRMTSRTEPEATTTWTYDTASGPTSSGHWLGKVASISTPAYTVGSITNPAYSETYSYDQYGRGSSVSRTIDGAAYTVSQTYDGYSRPDKTIYPTGFQTKNAYNAFGFLKEIRRADSGKTNLFWEADHYAVDGRIDGEIYGNGLVNDRIYSKASGRLQSANVDLGTVHTAPYKIQQLTYTHDTMGNVKRRYDSAIGLDEYFSYADGSDGYDGLDRLHVHRVSGGATVTVSYDQTGNITNKSDVGAYGYNPSSHPHAVTSAGSNSYTYDANGNMSSGGGRTITWSSFNQVLRVDMTGGKYSQFGLDSSRERVKQLSNGATTIYVGTLFERVTSGTSVDNKHYIFAPTGRIAVYTEHSNATNDVRYFHTDGLGSLTVVTDENGFVMQRFAYDAWGKRSNVDLKTFTQTPTTLATNGGYTRGFTDQEQLDDLGLVHMNGRVYDPVLGRFLSADPNIDGAYDSQGYNRYSYVGNNPLGATDPTGYFKLKDALVIAAVVVAAIVTAGVAVYAAGVAMGYSGMTLGFAMTSVMTGSVGTWGAAWAAIAGAGAGFGSGFAGSLLNGSSVGAAFKAGVVGALVGAVSAGIANKIGDFAEENEWFRGLGQDVAHGTLQGALTEATGGSFRHGFYAGFSSSALADPIAEVAPDSTFGQTTAAAIVGGTASAIGGGKFANGAASGAFTYLFNHAAHPKLERYSFWDGLKDAASGAMQGAAAFVDGVIPFGDPLENQLHLYDSHQYGLNYSQQVGAYTRDAVLTVATAGGTVEAETAARAGVEVAERNVVKDKVFRWGVGSFKEKGVWLRNKLHFHLGPGEGPMTHHLPYQAQTWKYHAWATIKNWWMKP